MDPGGEIENFGKIIFKIRIPNFCYIQVIVFYLGLKRLLRELLKRLLFLTNSFVFILHKKYDFTIIMKNIFKGSTSFAIKYLGVEMPEN